MARDSKHRPASTYPPEYMKLFQHVVQTGKEITISSLGPARGKYTALRHSMNSWRSALKREGSPLADDLYAVVCHIEQVSINGQVQYVAILRKRDTNFGAALAQIDVPDLVRLEAFEEQDKEEGKEREHDAEHTATKTIDEIFGKS